MDIKVGFVDNPRDLVITSADEQDKVVAEVEKFLAEGQDGAAATMTLKDNKGSVFVIVRGQVAYVEVGSSAQRPVGFI
ncbi:MAG: DUF3107 domain-containing protein [Corynebacterium sp.]|uniref:DUF3107 domain-containing protein n=1 Tax=unclassified Corynebacterium TaxID=2624378 RepID=UPI002648A725|nr:DUF3107 domain-containing protein [Corynebacterium sp.]MDN5582561.1 DUF3107 domain-containing protein [Corynebacterium sp.]MDN5720881.1 DUF3107 domain-containing protein [Corynebacterium sp.]MDN6325537.1 DUF3107 domain-containing protein [Corynebacterium sp.]MDN6387356.1 DUF3107 domain-containing protein [Corynebacterium sp.]MDN6510510.1 DUF3107 domain-containing protein [Corynebacterium sp.]